MIKIEILRRAVEKAEENGCDRCLSSWFDYHNEADIRYHKHYSIIFSHNFAKAFWGKQTHCTYRGSYDCQICNCGEYHTTDCCWEYHLQQMVLEKEPIKYLEQFI